MEVLIVSKTRMNNNFVCVGGLVLEDYSFIRLLDENGYNLSANTRLEVGEIYDLDYYSVDYPEPPHVEDVIVEDYSFVERFTDLGNFLKDNDLISWEGHVDHLFDGLLNWTSGGSGYIPSEGPLPDQSVGFWIADKPLIKSLYNDKVRYKYQNGYDYRNISYVGLQDPVDEIPAGTVIRVSLSRLFPKPGSNIQAPKGYYLQLSGWYPENNLGGPYQRNQPFTPSDDIIPGYDHITYADDYFERNPGANYYDDVDLDSRKDHEEEDEDDLPF